VAASATAAVTAAAEEEAAAAGSAIYVTSSSETLPLDPGENGSGAFTASSTWRRHPSWCPCALSRGQQCLGADSPAAG
jgi:hypothetical protein